MLVSAPLTAQQLKRLKEQRQGPAGVSLLEPIMRRWWHFLLELIPPWVAANSITLAGLMCNVLSTLCLLIHCPGATEKAPSWVHALCAFSVFMYQSLDAVDGLQARRTGSNSPLGEFFDHGCDSISTVLVSVSVSISLRLGTDPSLLFFLCFAAMFMFYSIHWQTYVTGSLRVSCIDATEVQFVVIIIFALSAVENGAFWEEKLPVLELPMKALPVLLELLACFVGCIVHLQVIFSGGIGRNGSTVAGTSVISPVLHIGTVISLAAMIASKSPSDLFEQNLCLYVLTFGFSAAKITNKLVVARMTRSEMYLLDTAFLGPGLLFLNQYFNSVLSEHLLLWVALVLSAWDLLRYSLGICLQISSHRHIVIFKPVPTATRPTIPQRRHK
uniref:cholinephosphotransferase 1 n=1 Tax=Myxine glutinosa TaxID=7769 RepID=UPI00358F1D6D